MQPRNLPTIDARYWTAIVAASMCGANMGDFFSHYLHLGHARGLLPLAVLFGVVLWIESRSRRATELYYWLAIIVVRTAATNLADLTTHDLKLGYVLAEAGLSSLMILLLLVDRIQGAANRDERRADGRRSDLPSTDVVYWILMLAAGTLGTVLGDWVAEELNLGVGWGSLVLAVIFAIVLLASERYGAMAKPWYWLSIVAARTLGTTLGDFVASRHGLNVGLPVSTLCTSLLLVAVLVFWRRDDAMRLRPT